jgi:hypothetical protein
LLPAVRLVIDWKKADRIFSGADSDQGKKAEDRDPLRRIDQQTGYLSIRAHPSTVPSN